MGESVSEGTVARWVKAVGDTVREGETVVEVTTDKVDVEVPSPAAGRLEQIVVEEGATVEVGATLALIASGVPTNGEVKAPAPATGDGRASGATAVETTPVAPEPPPVETAAPAPIAAPAATEAPAAEIEEPPEPPAAVPPAPPIPADEGIGLNPVTTPLARRRAAVDGVDVNKVDGSGP